MFVAYAMSALARSLLSGKAVSYFPILSQLTSCSFSFLVCLINKQTRRLNILNFHRNAYFATGPKQALGYGLGLASRFLCSS